jgi:hypothetical protein
MLRNAKPYSLFFAFVFEEPTKGSLGSSLYSVANRETIEYKYKKLVTASPICSV